MIYREVASIAGRPGLEDVGDVDLFTREAHRLDDVIELPPRPDKRPPTRSSSAPRFADKHQLRLGTLRRKLARVASTRDTWEKLEKTRF